MLQFQCIRFLSSLFLGGSGRGGFLTLLYFTEWYTINGGFFGW